MTAQTDTFIAEKERVQRIEQGRVVEIQQQLESVRKAEQERVAQMQLELQQVKAASESHVKEIQQLKADHARELRQAKAEIVQKDGLLQQAKDEHTVLQRRIAQIRRSPTRGQGASATLVGEAPAGVRPHSSHGSTVRSKSSSQTSRRSLGTSQGNSVIDAQPLGGAANNPPFQFTATDSTSRPQRNQPASVGGSGAAASRPTSVVSAQHPASQSSVSTVRRNINIIHQNAPGGVYHPIPAPATTEGNTQGLASNPVPEPLVPPPVPDRVTGMGAANFTGPFASASSQGAGQSWVLSEHVSDWLQAGQTPLPVPSTERSAPRGGPARNPRDASGNPLHAPTNRGNLGDAVPSNPPYTMPYRDYRYQNQPMVGSHGLAVPQGRHAPALHGNVGPAHYVPQARDNWGSLTGDPDPYQRYGEPPPYPAVNQLPYWAPPGGVQPPNHQTRDAYGNPMRQERGRDRDRGPVGRDAKLSKYNGNVPWRAYEVKVLRMARTYNWDNDMIIVKLVDALQDDALKFYSSLEVDVQDNYELLSRRMNKRFGPQEPPQTVRKELHMVEQKPEEPMEEWAERCQRLAKDAWGGTSAALAEEQAVDAFLNGTIEKDAALTVVEKEPPDMDTALDMLKKAIHRRKAIQVRSRTTQKARVVSFATEAEPVLSARVASVASSDSSIAKIDKVESDVKELKSTMDKVLELLAKQTRPRSPSPGACFRCGKHGHLARDCPNRPRSPSPAAKQEVTPVQSPENK